MIRQCVCVCILYAIAAAAAVSAQGNLPVSSPDGLALERLAESTGIRQFTVQSLQPAGDNDTLTIPLQVNGLSCTAVLYPHSVRSPSYAVRVIDRAGVAQDFPGPPITSYRGKIEGQLEGRVIASVREGKIDATIQTSDAPDGQWVIRPIEGVEGFSPADHLIYRSIDAPSVPSSCGVQSTAEPSDEIPPPPATEPLDVLVCELACDADVEYYALNGSSVEATVADIENIINGVSAIYERDIKVTFQITGIVVRTAEPDPYDTPNPYALLKELSDDWKANHKDIPHDLVQLFTGRTLTGCIGIADEDTLCYGYSIVRSRNYTDLAQRVSLSAHEIGHNFDADHCDYMDNWCRIMCPSLGGCSGALQSFGPWEISRLRAGMIGKSCLSPAIVEIPITTLPFFDDFSIAPKPGYSKPLDPARWTAADRVLAIGHYMRLIIEWSRYSDFTKYATIRTLPMVLGGPAKVSYKVCQWDVEAGQMLKVEYFNSSLWQWQPLDSITSTGGSNPSTTFVLRELAVPLDAMGRYFAVRFSSYGDSVATRSCWWYVDDVSIIELQNLADINGDKKVNLEDWAVCAAAWLSNEGDPAWNPACNLKQPPDTTINLDDFKVWVENWLRTL